MRKLLPGRMHFAPELVDEHRHRDQHDRGRALHELVRALNLTQRFELLDTLQIYAHPETASGPGSTIEETRVLRRALPNLISCYGIRSIIDVPCGDFNWMQHVPLSGIQYLGIDIVSRIVERNKRLYQSEERRFERLDATKDALPRADLILCRDLLIHLSLTDIELVLRRLYESRSTWLLVTHFANTSRNTEIQSGDFRPINLCLPPFTFSDPTFVIYEDSQLDNGKFRDRAMALWPVSEIRLS